MLGSTVLEVMIGLALVYLLLSLVCSTIQEAIAAWLNWRGKMLREAIERLLAGSRDLARALYEQPLLRALGREGRDPSYMPNRTFADALVGLLGHSAAGPAVRSAAERLTAFEAALSSGKVGHSQLPSELRATLVHALEAARDKLGVAGASAEAQLEQLKREIDAWFERTMQRATGWYRRKSQAWQFGIALVVVFLTNADSLMITEQLASDPAARAAAVQAAVELVNEPPPALTGAVVTSGAQPTSETVEAEKAWREARERAEVAVDELYATTARAKLQFGWPDARWRDANSEEAQLKPWQRWARKTLGLLVTVCAVALGAPFWFQMLEKLAGLRGAGKKVTPAPTDAKPS